MMASGLSMIGPCPGSSRSGRRLRTRSSDARYSVKSPPRPAGMTIVPPGTRQVATENIGASTETVVIRRVAGRVNGRQHSIASFDGFVVEDRLVAAAESSYSSRRPPGHDCRDASRVVGMTMRDEDQGQGVAGELARNVVDVFRLPHPRIDERWHAAGKQVRVVAGRSGPRRRVASGNQDVLQK